SSRSCVSLPLDCDDLLASQTVVVFEMMPGLFVQVAMLPKPVVLVVILGVPVEDIEFPMPLDVFFFGSRELIRPFRV
ncbi:MAG: hypothetical protein WKH64_01865, partial [Chloroflexia bacterium]